MYLGHAALLVLVLFLVTSCGENLPYQTNTPEDAKIVPTYPENPANLRVQLIDAPNDNLSEVHINISHMELLLEKEGKQGRLIIGEGTGDVDLLQLQNGVMLNIADVSIPAGIGVKQIRLILNNEGHYAVKNDGTTCDLATPSGQQSGVKILLKSPVEFESDSTYSMVIDFDAKKSIVQQGHGGCLLKPVLRLPSFTKQIPSDNQDGSDPSDGGGDSSGDSGGDDDTDGNTGDTGTGNDGSDTNNDEPVTDGTDSNIDDYLGLDGFDPTDPSTWPDEVTEDDLAIFF